MHLCLLGRAGQWQKAFSQFVVYLQVYVGGKALQWPGKQPSSSIAAHR